MQRTVLLIIIVLCFSYKYTSAQEKSAGPGNYKNIIGVQLNPYLDQNETFSAIVVAFRYSSNLKIPLQLGGEISGFLPYRFGNNDLIQTYKLKIGPTVKYIFLPSKRLHPYAEYHAFFGYNYTPETTSSLSSSDLGIGMYLAPGVSLIGKRGKVSFDFYYKLYIHPGSMFYERSVPSYKLNFHF